MVKSSGEITPKLKPIFKTINSVKPLVFINHPRAEASLLSIPLTLAAMKVPTYLPKIATITTKAHNAHNSGRFNSPISVLSPL